MSKFFANIWAKEPVLVTLFGSAAFWPAFFSLLTAFHHGFTTPQEQAIVGVVGVLIATGIIRGQVSPLNPTPSSDAVSDATRAKLPIVLLAVLLGSSAFGCGGVKPAQPPAGTYTPPVLNTFNADQLMNALNAVGKTARDLNATTGPLHLSDQNTAYVRDGSLIAAAVLNAWGTGATTTGLVRAALEAIPAGVLRPDLLAAAEAAADKAIADHGADASALYIVVDVYHTLRANITIDVSTNPTLAIALDAVDTAIALVPIPQAGT